MYYNTTNVKDKERAAYMMAVDTQNEFVLEVFKEHDYTFFTPSQILTISEGYGKNWPITSIRRSLNTLTNNGLLSKLPEKSIGMYGRPEHRWKINK